jgi:hypothetical protein
MMWHNLAGNATTWAPVLMLRQEWLKPWTTHYTVIVTPARIETIGADFITAYTCTCTCRWESRLQVSIGDEVAVEA